MLCFLYVLLFHFPYLFFLFSLAKIVNGYRDKITDKSKNSKITSYANNVVKCANEYVKKMEKIKSKYNLDAVEDDTESEQSQDEHEEEEEEEEVVGNSKKRKKKDVSTKGKKSI